MLLLFPPARWLASLLHFYLVALNRKPIVFWVFFTSKFSNSPGIYCAVGEKSRGSSAENQLSTFMIISFSFLSVQRVERQRVSLFARNTSELACAYFCRTTTTSSNVSACKCVLARGEWAFCPFDICAFKQSAFSERRWFIANQRSPSTPNVRTFSESREAERLEQVELPITRVKSPFSRRRSYSLANVFQSRCWTICLDFNTNRVRFRAVWHDLPRADEAWNSNS